VFVGLQEVTTKFLTMLKERMFSASVGVSLTLLEVSDVYDISCVTSYHDSALLILKKYNPSFHLHTVVARRKGTTSTRTINIGVIEFEQMRIACATVHLESIFFTEEAITIKSQQLRQMADALESLKADGCFCMGDMNLTGKNRVNDYLDREIQAIADCGFVDLWLKLHPTNEDQYSDDWKENHCTWDGANNKLVKYPNEFHRPDRLFLKKGLYGVAIERVIGNPVYSDHYGLEGLLSIVEPK
jgi:endonuclease/exonuclease/phosphatase family metal-dependent hydrolase